MILNVRFRDCWEQSAPRIWASKQVRIRLPFISIREASGDRVSGQTCIYGKLHPARDVKARQHEKRIRKYQRIPARIKLCTNWRWNSRKATNSGAEVISVAAVITDQSMP